MAKSTKVISTLDEMVKCVAREVKLREAVYPNQIARGKMKEGEADRELRTMRDVLQFLLEEKAQRETTTAGETK